MLSLPLWVFLLLWGLAAAGAVAAVMRILGCKPEVADYSLDCTCCNSAARTEDMRPHIVAVDCSVDRIVATARDHHTVGIAVLAERIEHQAGKHSLAV